MKEELINPFIEAATKVLVTMGQTEASPGVPALKEDNRSWGAVSGVIGMVGDEVTGNMVISFDEGAILDIVSKMLMETFTEINKDVIDAVGEITNMICGGTKSILSQNGYKISMASPMVIVGKNIELTQLSKSPIVTIPFSTAKGKFVIEANLSRKK